jgi:dipeptidyl aminopeptidase/acylaminoacyl peptidase
MQRNGLVIPLLLLFIVVACAPLIIGEVATPTLQLPTRTTQPAATSLPSATPTFAPSPTATLVPPHPLSIAYLQAQAYAAELVIEEQIADGVNYSQYIVSYRSEGNKIFALLTVPFGETPSSGWPVIIFNHGYIPPDQYRTTERYVDYVIAFATHGYIVLRPDYRGHGSSEGVPGGAYSRPDYVIDVLNATAAIKRYPAADPDRIGMWGHSMGGYITARAMVIDPHIKAGVIWGGVVGSYADICQHWFRCDDEDNSRNFARGSTMSEFGSPTKNPEFWAAASMTSYLGLLGGPIQLHHATADATVPIALSRVFYQELLDAGIDAEYYEYQGDNHNISEHFLEAVKHSIYFFEIHVKGID